jgi:hypothetical protein
LERLRATTELKKLAVKEKHMYLTFQEANNLIELSTKLAKIKDPLLREKMGEIIDAKIKAFRSDASVRFPEPTPTSDAKAIGTTMTPFLLPKPHDEQK